MSFCDFRPRLRLGHLLADQTPFESPWVTGYFPGNYSLPSDAPALLDLWDAKGHTLVTLTSGNLNSRSKMLCVLLTIPRPRRVREGCLDRVGGVALVYLVHRGGKPLDCLSIMHVALSGILESVR